MHGNSDQVYHETSIFSLLCFGRAELSSSELMHPWAQVHACTSCYSGTSHAVMTDLPRARCTQVYILRTAASENKYGNMQAKEAREAIGDWIVLIKEAKHQHENEHPGFPCFGVHSASFILIGTEAQSGS